MKKTRILALFAALALSVSLLAGCQPSGDSAEVTSSPSGGEDDPLKIVYLLNGTLGSMGFSDNAAEGLYRLRDELGCEIKIIEMGNDQTTYESYFRDESEKDWDLIIGATFTLKELVEQMAIEYPDQNYMFIDGAVDFEKVTTDNLMGISYQSNETGFMAGALAALMMGSGNAKIDPAQKILGFVGSMDAPNINDFLVGYIEGIQYVDPEIKLLTSYVGSFEDVPKCLEMTNQLYNQGAQIVYGPTSASIMGAVQASADNDKYFIACDNDVWAMMKDTNADAVRNVLSSSMKNVGDSIFTAVQGMIDGSYSMGQNYVLGIKDGAVGLAENDNYTALVPEDIRTRLDEIAGEVAAGTITVGAATGMTTEEVAALRDGLKP